MAQKCTEILFCSLKDLCNKKCHFQYILLIFKPILPHLTYFYELEYNKNK